MAITVEQKRGKLHDAKQQSPQVNFSLSIAKLILISAVVMAIVWRVSEPKNTPFNYYLTLAWAMYFPVAIVSFIGAFASRNAIPSTYEEKIDNFVIFLIPSVCRMDVIPALTRVIDSILEYAPANITNFRIDVVIDEGAIGEKTLKNAYKNKEVVRVIVVPRDFACPNGTIHKARANQYAMELRKKEGENRTDVFVYHLDDDTAVGADTISSIAEFISTEGNDKHLAQGVLTFPYDLSPSLFSRLADSVRPVDDLTRFYFFTGMRRTPQAGLHGEHLLIRSSIEEEIGWDFGRKVKVEDAYFAMMFCKKYPGKSSFLNSCTYGASPSNIKDLISQRKRWAGGLVGLLFDKRIPLRNKLPLAYSVSLWTSGIIQHVGIMMLISWSMGINNTSPISKEFIPIWTINFSFQIWMYLEGLRINLESCGKKKLLPFLSLLSLPLIFVFSFIEAWSATRGVIDFIRRDNNFAVIKKEL